MLRRFIGDKAFYKMALSVALPILIQNAITNFVSLLDNIMVGQVGTLQMSGVSIVNQLMFVFNLCIFGAISGAGIFTAQFAGSKDDEGVRHTFRFKILICLGLTVLGVGLFLAFGDQFVSLYLQGDATPEDAAATLEYARGYLQVMLFGLLPFAISSAYAGTLRETGQTVVPMAAGITAVLVNLVLNALLIFGVEGFIAPMGVQGAAVATVLARYVELAINVVWLHTHSKTNPYIKGAYRSLYIPRGLLRRICIKGLPLLVNEALWSFGMAVLNQCYSTRGLDVVAATNISSTIWNLFSVSFMALGSAVGIIVGQMLGAGRSAEEVRDTDRKLIAFAVLSCGIFGTLLWAVSRVFPQIYNTTEQVRQLATALICVGAVLMPFNAFTNATYFTLRSGGQTMVTFLFDSCFVWAVCVPVAFCLSRFTGLSILPLYIICQGLELIKCVLGAWMLKKGAWIQNLAQ